jgi:hypothetical protein
MKYRPNADATILMVKARRFLSSSNITFWSLIWIGAAAIAYGIFNWIIPQQAQHLWFKISTYVVTDLALFMATFLCFRNWQHQRVPSGKWVWLLFSVATFSYLVGEIILSLWELYWGLPPHGSPADLAFVGFYILMVWGLGIVVKGQQITLSWPQGLVLLVVSATAMVIALHLLGSAEKIIPSPATYLHSNPWVTQFDRSLKPFAANFNRFYVLADVLLIILATILSLGFWGGRLGKTWQIMAQAIACLYIADLRFDYLSKTTGYTSGDFIEVFWIAGILQLSIAAAVEWENSYRVKRLLE